MPNFKAQSIFGAVLTLLLISIPGYAQQAAAEPTPTTPATAATPAPVVTPAPAATPEPAATTAQPATTPAPATAETAKPTAEFGYLVCYRQKRFMGAALNTSVFLDEVELADLDNGCYIIVKAKPGEHKLRGDAKKDFWPINVEAGKVYYYRIELVMGMWKGHGRLASVSNVVGETEFKEWKLKFAPDVRKPDMVIQTLP